MQVAQQRLQILPGIPAQQKDRFELRCKIRQRQILLHGNQIGFMDLQSVDGQDAVSANRGERVEGLMDDAVAHPDIRGLDRPVQGAEAVLGRAHDGKSLPVQIPQDQAFPPLEGMRARNQDPQGVAAQDGAQKPLSLRAHIHQDSRVQFAVIQPLQNRIRIQQNTLNRQRRKDCAQPVDLLQLLRGI